MVFESISSNSSKKLSIDLLMENKFSERRNRFEYSDISKRQSFFAFVVYLDYIEMNKISNLCYLRKKTFSERPKTKKSHQYLRINTGLKTENSPWKKVNAFEIANKLPMQEKESIVFEKPVILDFFPQIWTIRMLIQGKTSLVL